MTRTQPAGAAGAAGAAESATAAKLHFHPASAAENPPGSRVRPQHGPGRRFWVAELNWNRFVWKWEQPAGGSGKIGRPRRFSGSGRRQLKRDQRDRFPPRTGAVAGPFGPRRALAGSKKLVSASRLSSRRLGAESAGWKRRTRRKTSSHSGAGGGHTRSSNPSRTGPDRTMPVRKKGKPLSLGAVCLLAANG